MFKHEIFDPGTELLEFANNFSKNYKDLEPATYFSKDRNFRIDYVKHRPIINGPVGIKTDDDIMEFEESFFKKNDFHSDTIFYLIIWCTIQRRLNDRLKSDSIALGYYFTKTDRPLSNLLKDMLIIFNYTDKNVDASLNSLFGKHNFGATTARIIKLKEYIDKYNAAKK